MQKRVIYLWIPVIVLFTIFTSCRDTDSVTDNNNSSKNIPVTGNTPNAFSFVVDAKSFDYFQTHPLQISSDTVSIGLTVTGYVSGSGKIELTDGNGGLLYSKDFNGSMVSGDVIKFSIVPKSVNFYLLGFTGKVVLGLAGK